MHPLKLRIKKIRSDIAQIQHRRAHLTEDQIGMIAQYLHHFTTTELQTIVPQCLARMTTTQNI